MHPHNHGKQITTLLVIIALLLLMLFFLKRPKLQSTSTTSTNGCHNLTEFTWKLDLVHHSVKELNKLESPVSFCSPLPVSGLENTLLRVQTNSDKTLFERKIFVNLYSFADGQDNQGALHGGANIAQDTIVTSSIMSEKSAKIQFISMKDDTILAEGRL